MPDLDPIARSFLQFIFGSLIVLLGAGDIGHDQVNLRISTLAGRRPLIRSGLCGFDRVGKIVGYVGFQILASLLACGENRGIRLAVCGVQDGQQRLRLHQGTLALQRRIGILLFPLIEQVDFLRRVFFAAGRQTDIGLALIFPGRRSLRPNQRCQGTGDDNPGRQFTQTIQHVPSHPI